MKTIIAIIAKIAGGRPTAPKPFVPDFQSRHHAAQDAGIFDPWKK